MTSLAEKLESQQPMTADDAKEAVKEKSQEVRTQASDRLRQEVESRSSRAAEQVQSFAQTMRRTASELRAQGQHGQGSLFDQAAIRAEQLAGYLTDADADQLLSQASSAGGRVLQLARRRSPLAAAGGAARKARENPLVVAAGAITVGLVVRRRMQGRSGSPRGEQQALEPLTKKELQERAASAGVAVTRSMTKQDLIAALQEQARGAGAKSATGRRQVEQVLEAVRYPAGKAKLLSEAERQGVGQQLRRTLERLPQRTFRRPSEVRKAIDTLD